MALRPQTRGNGSAPREPVELPARYDVVWDEPFRTAIEERLRPGMAILDVGSGRNPTIPVDERPAGTHYVGLDVSAAELAAAPTGSYAEDVVADVGVRQEPLVGCFDLVVSWQVLEHVEDLGAAVEHIKAYLKPGGTFVAMFSGSRSAFALVNRVIPFSVGAPVVSRVMGRSSSNPVFPAYYDRCRASELRAILRDWSGVDITPFFRGAGYFRFSRALARAYLAYEDWAAGSRRTDLATHYLLVATR
jgi:2-polyprenyl-6-hydroxyphenyl methylase/3-demethylubiquinone-9 3-methyltransferase